MQDQPYEQVLDFWFGEQTEGYPVEDRRALWFGGKENADRQIHSKFSHYVEDALNNQLEEWRKTPRGQLALIILLDQLTRSIYRKTPKAFSGDPTALLLAREAIEKGYNKELTFSERGFIYMPLMHSEKLSDQELCIEMLTRLQQEVPDTRKEQVGTSIHFAKDHRDLIARFGRFPYRNKVLNRKSTPEERDYLNNGADTYGQ